MGLLSRTRTGFRLTVGGLRVVAAEPRLLVFPLCSAIATVGFAAAVLVTMTTADLFGGVRGWIALFVVYVATTFSTTFFAAGLVHATASRFAGRSPPLRRSLYAAADRVVPIFAWAVIAGLVGLFLKWMTESDSALTRLVGTAFALGWTAMTFFVLPAIVLRQSGVRGMIGDSARTFRSTWGETLSAGFGLGVVQFLLAIGLASAAGLVAYAIAAAIGAPSGLYVWSIVGGLFLAYLTGRTARTIVKTALFVYAARGVEPIGFSGFDYESLDGRAPDIDRGSDADAR